MAFEHLSAKGRIGNLEIKNRLVMTAMGVGVGDHSGIASDGFIEFYRKRAEGGVGLIMTAISTPGTFMASRMTSKPRPPTPIMARRTRFDGAFAPSARPAASARSSRRSPA